MKRLAILITVLFLLTTGTPTLASTQSNPGVDVLRGAWGGTLTSGMPTLPPGQFVDVQLNLYFSESSPGDAPGKYEASGYSCISWEEPSKPDRIKGTMLPMMAQYTQVDESTYSITILASFQVPPWAPLPGTVIYKLVGTASLTKAGVKDDTMEGMYYFKARDGSVRSNNWSVTHLDRRSVKAPEVTLDDPILQLRMTADSYALIGAQGDWTQLEVRTNVISSAARVTLPGGESVVLPPYTDVFSLNVDFINEFRFHERIPVMPTAGGMYSFTLLDNLGNPLPGAQRTDVYLGGYVPEPPENVNASLVTDGILLNWTPAPVIPSSFDPANGIGFYQIAVFPLTSGTQVFGASQIRTPMHLIPYLSSKFGPNDSGTPLSQLPDGKYGINMHSFSIAPAGSGGSGIEAQVQYAQTETWFFKIAGGVVTYLGHGPI